MTAQADPLRARGSDVAALVDTLRRGGSALESVPHQIKRILQDGTWRHFVTRLGKEVHHERFADFVATPPLAGLGADMALVRRMISDDTEALDLLDQALQNLHGGDRSKNDNVQLAPSGNRRERALRRLRKDAPELHADVLAGRLSAHAAMVKAGFRARTVSVPVSRPDAAARALRRNMNGEELQQLIKLLSEEPTEGDPE